MKEKTKGYHNQTTIASHGGSKYAEHRTAIASAAWIIILAAAVGGSYAVPAETGRTLLPTAVYLTMSLLPFTVGTLAPSIATFIAALLLSVISTPILVAGSGLAAGADILLLVTLPTATGYAALGLFVATLNRRLAFPATILTTVLLIAPLFVYAHNPAFTAFTALPGAGPMGLTSMLLGRPPQWAPFGPAWISTGLYAAAGILSGLFIAVWRNLRPRTSSRSD